jgi:F-type H+-transporting ATPase subunit b
MLLAQAAKPNLINIDYGLMVWTLVCFLVVLFVLKKYAYGPIQDLLEQRRKLIAADLDNAESARTEAQTTLEEYRAQLAEARKEAGRIVEDARKAMEEKRHAELATIEADKERQLQRAREEIAAETRHALATIKDQVAELTMVATEKIVRSKLDEAEQRRLIDAALADVDFEALAPEASGD